MVARELDALEVPVAGLVQYSVFVVDVAVEL